ncbi:MAG: hypothetical protein HKN87_11475 [Saprospiraceae bacterium]|nr:hypothetical protein [Saprospiraceae bacterium]
MSFMYSIQPAMGSDKVHSEEFINLLDQYLTVIDRLSNQGSQVAKLEQIKDLPQVAEAALRKLEVAESRWCHSDLNSLKSSNRSEGICLISNLEM